MSKINEYGGFTNLLPEVCVVMTVMIIAVIAVIFFLRQLNVTNRLVTKRVRIRKKIVKNQDVESYIVECQNGERLKLKSYQASTLPISVGDVGVIVYRGKTIQEFTKQKIFTRK